MPTSELEFSREYDLPAVIVWDALIDEVLVEGWLAPSRIDPRVGGLYWLDWRSGRSLEPTNGSITVLDEPLGGPGRLEITTDNIGTLDFSLTPTPDGTRGSGTLLRLRILVDTEPGLLAVARADWLSNFDQLEDLLRGHPVDWENWRRDRGEAWEEYLREAASGN